MALVEQTGPTPKKELFSDIADPTTRAAVISGYFAMYGAPGGDIALKEAAKAAHSVEEGPAGITNE